MANFLHVYVGNGIPKPWYIDTEFIEIIRFVNVEDNCYFFGLATSNEQSLFNFIGSADEDYIIYNDRKFTRDEFGQLSMILETEKLAKSIEELI